MTTCSLAVDIGASSGRVVAGYVVNGQMKLDEIHRFENKMVKKGDHYCWDVNKLFSEMKKGILKSKEQGYHPESIGVDTWAVDFVLLDDEDQLLTEAVAYRDPRTDGMMEEVLSIIDKDELYSKTGIQYQKFNTIYQLYYLKKNNPEILEKATSFLMIPDYLHFLLTGQKVNEYTNATTTQLVNATTHDWDQEILQKLAINEEIFQEISLPKTSLGHLKSDLVAELGGDMEVILPATHDTGSAIVSVPEPNDTIYISSGTWSLIGVENMKPILNANALESNFTNEGGIDYRFRFLKNIMGLWMIQEVKRNFNDQYSFADFAEMAEMEQDFHSTVHVDDNRFLNPENMIKEIQLYCKETNQPVPETPGEMARCVFNSLAISYQKAIEEIEDILEKDFETINIIGGGSKNEMLNQLIANTTGKDVITGPTEATSIGNITAQLIALNTISSVEEARSIIQSSFPLKQFKRQ